MAKPIMIGAQQAALAGANALLVKPKAVAKAPVKVAPVIQKPATTQKPVTTTTRPVDFSTKGLNSSNFSAGNTKQIVTPLKNAPFQVGDVQGISNSVDVNKPFNLDMTKKKVDIQPKQTLTEGTPGTAPKRSLMDIINGGRPIIGPDTFNFIKTKIDEINNIGNGSVIQKSLAKVNNFMKPEIDQAFSDVAIGVQNKLTDINTKAREDWTNPEVPFQEGVGAGVATVITSGLLGLTSSIQKLAQGSKEITTPGKEAQGAAKVVMGGFGAGVSVFAPVLSMAFAGLGELPGTKQVLDTVMNKGNDWIIQNTKNIPIWKDVDDETKNEVLGFARGLIAFGVLHKTVGEIGKIKTNIDAKGALKTDIKTAIDILKPIEGETIKDAYIRNMRTIRAKDPTGNDPTVKAKEQELNGAFTKITNAGIKDTVVAMKNNPGMREKIKDVRQNIKPKITESKEIKPLEEVKPSAEIKPTETAVMEESIDPKYQEKTTEPTPTETAVMEEQATTKLLLHEEARKYKTAEEFIKNNVVYHGTDASFDLFDKSFRGSAYGNTPSNKAGIFFTDQEGIAKTFGKNVKKANVIIKNPMIIDAKGAGYGDKFKNYDKFKFYLNDILGKIDKKKYDGVIVKNYKDVGKYGEDEILGTQFIPFDENQIKTESQLKQIREEANNKQETPMDSAVVEESPKYQEKTITEKDIQTQHPDIAPKADIQITDVYGAKHTLKAGDAHTPYEMKDGKVILQDGQHYVVSKNQYLNLKNNSLEDTSKEFAPELKGTEETSLSNKVLADYESLPKNVQKVVDKVDGGEIDAYKINEALKPLGYEADFGMDGEIEAIWKSGGEPTKYHQYTLPGGENYKEILIKAPVKDNYKLSELSQEHTALMKDISDRDGVKEKRAKEIEKEINNIRYKNNFQSSHWEEPNVLAHIRMNERTFDGKKVAFMEELQSDRAREARKNPIDPQIAEKVARREELDNKIQDLGEKMKKFADNKIKEENWTRSQFEDRVSNHPDNDWLKYKLERLDLLHEFNSMNIPEAIPSHPLLTNRQELAVKRALKEAVDNGAEYFAWINGEQTADRYGLSKEIESIGWNPGGEGKRIIDIVPKKSGHILSFQINSEGIVTDINKGEESWKGKPVSDILGKGIAEKIMEKPKGIVKEDGLNMGGEWAYNLYDIQVAKIVKALTGKSPEKIDMKVETYDPEQLIIKDSGETMTQETATPGMIFSPKTTDLTRKQTEYIVLKVYDNGKLSATAVNDIERIARKHDPVFRYALENGYYGEPLRKLPEKYIIGEIQGEYFVKSPDGRVIAMNKKKETTITHALHDINQNKKMSEQAYKDKEFLALIDMYLHGDIGNQLTQFFIWNKKRFQAVKLTPEVKAIIRGESPIVNKPSRVPKFLTPIDHPSMLETKFQEIGSERQITQKEAIANAKKRYPEIMKHFTVQAVETIFTPKGTEAFGSYKDSLVQLANNPKEFTMDHELFHGVMDLFLTAKEKAEILSEVQKATKILDPGKQEERAARNFEKYVQGKTTTNNSKVLDFFKKIWEAIKAVFKNKTKLENLYGDMLNTKKKREKIGIGKDPMKFQELTTEERAHLKGLSVEDYRAKFEKNPELERDPVRARFIREVAAVEAMEQRISNYKNRDTRDAKRKEREQRKERLIERIGHEYGLDANEAVDMYDEFVNTPYEKIYGKKKYTASKTIESKDVDIADILAFMEAIPEKVSKQGTLTAGVSPAMEMKNNIRKLVDRTTKEIQDSSKKVNIDAETKDTTFQIKTLTKQMVRLRNSGQDIEMIKKYNAIHTKIGELKLRKQLYTSVNKRIGAFEKQLDDYLASGGFIKSPRKLQLDHIQNLYQLNDHEMGRIVQGNYVSMSKDQWEAYFKRIHEKAKEIGDNKDLQELLSLTISSSELKKTENLRNAMELPTISDMTNQELRGYIDVLSSFEPRQTFLGPRMLQTIDLTSFKGAKTVKQLAVAISNEMGIPYEDIMKKYATMVKFKEEGKKLPLDVHTITMIEYFLNDAYLQDSNNPLVKALVGEYRKNNLSQMKTYMDFEAKIEGLVAKSRKSVGRSIGDRIIPEDKQVFKYIESENKEDMAKTMTVEQLELANEIIDFFSQARDYLVENKQLNAYRTDYITHIEKSRLEKIKNNGIKKAVIAMFNKKDQQLDFLALGKTGEVLGLEKFFKFALARVEGDYAIDPTQNVAKAVLRYAKSFYTKVGLDTTIPKMEAMAYVLADGKTQTFMKERLNNKKGRRIDHLIQGSKFEQIGMFIKSFTSIIDLGLNIPVALGSIIGGKYSMVSGQGAIKAGLGHARYTTKQGQNIMKDYQNVIGKSPWKELADPTKDIFKKGMDSLFILMSGFEHFSRGEFLLGEMTKKEFQEGELSPKRQAQIKLKIDRTFPAKGTKSLQGSTFLGQIGTQYKSWALPYLQNLYVNGGKIIEGIKEGRFEKKEGFELLKTVLLSVALIIAIKKLLNIETQDSRTGDENITPQNADKSFLGKLEYKIWTEATPIVQSMNLPTYTNVRTIGFITSIWNSLRLLIKAEKYKTTGDDYKKGSLKGLIKLKRTVFPSAIRNLIPKNNAGGLDLGTEGLDLGGIDLSDIDLSDVDLSDIDLSDIDLSSLK